MRITRETVDGNKYTDVLASETEDGLVITIISDNTYCGRILFGRDGFVSVDWKGSKSSLNILDPETLLEALFEWADLDENRDKIKDAINGIFNDVRYLNSCFKYKLKNNYEKDTK